MEHFYINHQKLIFNHGFCAYHVLDLVGEKGSIFLFHLFFSKKKSKQGGVILSKEWGERVIKKIVFASVINIRCQNRLIAVEKN